MLKLKVNGLTEMDRECVLTLDEMAVTPSVELHLGTAKLYGDVTQPEVATHAYFYVGSEHSKMKESSGLPLQWQFHY